MGVSFDGLLLASDACDKSIVVCPLDEASVVKIEVSENFHFLSNLGRFTILRVNNTSWSVDKKRFVGGKVTVFNVDYGDGFELFGDAECQDQVQRDKVVVQGLA